MWYGYSFVIQDYSCYVCQANDEKFYIPQLELLLL